jgi:hypothetical protein
MTLKETDVLVHDDSVLTVPFEKYLHFQEVQQGLLGLKDKRRQARVLLF